MAGVHANHDKFSDDESCESSDGEWSHDVEAIRVLSGALALPTCSLTALDLSGNRINRLGTFYLSKALKVSKSLRTLDLTGELEYRFLGT